MFRINVQVDIDGLMAQFDDIKDPSPAVSRALNKTVTTVRAKTAQAIRGAGYNIKSSDIKASLKTNRKATQQLLVAYLDATGRPIPLIKYGAREQKRPGGGVAVKVLNGSKTIAGAFIATMPSGHKGVFVRVGSAAHAALGLTGKHSGIHLRKSSYKHGLPILELYGPSVSGAFKRDTVQAAMEATARARFPVVLQQELNYLQLKQSGGV